MDLPYLVSAPTKPERRIGAWSAGEHRLTGEP
jgi:hypothetical protein